jgi:uncharacterized protein
MKLTNQEIEKIKHFFSDKPVKSVYLFGSYARGEASEDSDVDLLIDWDYTKPIGWNYGFWWEEVKNLLSKNVDFVSAKWVSPIIEKYINEDKVLIYEA